MELLKCSRCKRPRDINDFRTDKRRNSRRIDCKFCENKARKERAKRSERQDVESENAFKWTPVRERQKSSYRQDVEIKEENERLQELFQLTKKKLVSFEDLCNRMDLSPKKMRDLIHEAEEEGYPVKLTSGYVGVDMPKPRDDVQDTHIPPVVGEEQVLGVVSDPHYGSKYCLRGAIKDYVKYAYQEGVRHILMPGDLVDGDYRHGKFEMTHLGLTEQVKDLRKNLPQHEGLKYHAITGNHDFTFTEQSGIDVGKYIEETFRAHGRQDFKAYGDRGAFLQILGVLFHLWHPKASPGYAVSYQLQKKIEAYSPSEKPQVLLTGHWHRYCVIEERAVQAIACPTFQSGGSAFSRSLTTGAPAIGGLILRWKLTADGTMRDFSVAKRTYFKSETVYRVETPNGISV